MERREVRRMLANFHNLEQKSAKTSPKVSDPKVADPKVTKFRRRMIVVFAAVLLFTPPLWILMNRNPPFALDRIAIVPKEVQAGHDARVDFYIKRRRLGDCKIDVQHRNGKLEVLPSDATTAEDQFTRTLVLPENAPLGPRRIAFNVCYTCSALQGLLRWPICTPTPEVEFIVTK